METYKELIQEYSAFNSPFGLSGLWKWLSSKGMTARNTMNCTLSRMIERGDIVRTGRGKYEAASGKRDFIVELTQEEAALAAQLKSQFPLAPICIYNGKALSALQHHLSLNAMTYVETDRSVTEAVFGSIRESAERVWLAPDADIIYRYVDLAKGGVIVKPLTTEAPLREENGVLVPTIEKLLVDIYKDSDFAYLQGEEAKLMWENAKNIYNINTTRLRRYARRRGIKTELTDELLSMG